MRVDYELTEADAIAAARFMAVSNPAVIFHRRRSRRRLWVFTGIVLLIGCSWAAIRARTPIEAVVGAVLYVVIFGVVMIPITLLRWAVFGRPRKPADAAERALRVAIKHGRARLRLGKIAAETDGGTLVFRSAGTETRITLDTDTEIQLAEGQIFLLRPHGMEAQIPLRAFPDDATRDAFLARLSGATQSSPPTRRLLS